MAQVLFTYDGHNLASRDKLFGARKGMFEHRAAADKVDVLFRQVATPGISNITLQSFTIAAS
jgi:hypothetical protein